MSDTEECYADNPCTNYPEHHDEWCPRCKQIGARMSDSEYNGWKNYPTWAVNLWLSNDEGLYDTTRELAEHHAGSTARGKQDMAYSLKAWVTDDLAPDLGASFAADLLGYALDQVDWEEIASAWLTEVEA